MADIPVLDIVLAVVLFAYLVSGLRRGFLVTLGGIAGFVAGAVAAFLAIPLVSSRVSDDAWRLAAVIATVVALVILGQAVGTGLGASIRRWLNFPTLRAVDRLLGGAANMAVAALVVSMLAFGVGTLGVPVLSQQIAASKVINGIDRLTPPEVQTWAAQLRALAVDDGIPTILRNVPPGQPVKIPEAPLNRPELAAAAESVLRIAGTAFQCGQNQTGSGFVVAPERVMTNAHVVAGVNQPVVELPGVGALPGKVVHFDPARDIAVLAVAGLDRAALPLGRALPDGTAAAFAGYPAGGPYRIQPAAVRGLSPVRVANIYGADPTMLEVYSLAARVQQGNSGGPLLDRRGRVAGMVFAKSTGSEPVGYALSLRELRPVLQRASALTEPVSAGQCTQR